MIIKYKCSCRFNIIKDELSQGLFVGPISFILCPAHEKEILDDYQKHAKAMTNVVNMLDKMSKDNEQILKGVFE